MRTAVAKTLSHKAEGGGNSPRARATLRRSPEARLRWLMSFALAAPPESEEAFSRAWDVLFFVQNGLVFYGNHRARPEHRTAILAAHTALQELFLELAHGRSVHFHGAALFWTFTPPASRSAGARTSAPIRQASDL